MQSIMSKLHLTWLRLVAAVVAPAMFVATLTVAGGEAMATESAAETAVKTIAEKIGSEGIAIFLIVVTAITALIAVLIAVTLGIKKIHSLVK